LADQLFLASFGVDIDESGVSRLQKILAENRTMAESLSSAFDTASESVKAFREEIATDLPTLFSGSGYLDIVSVLGYSLNDLVGGNYPGSDQDLLSELSLALMDCSGEEKESIMRIFREILKLIRRCHEE